MTDVTSDLNATITAAVNARVEAAVAEALSGNQLITSLVAQSLSKEIEVRDVNNSYSGRMRKTTFLRETIDAAIKAATEQAVRRVIAEEQAAIEAAVTTELRRNVKSIAAQLVGKVAESVENTYGVNVTLRYPNRS